MTPERQAKLQSAIDLIHTASNRESFDVEPTRNALIGIGAVFVDGNTNTMRLGGVTASCTWDNGEHLLTRWAANARAAIANEGKGS